jgi:DNA-directed RNA polymerase III subunit RPC8
MSAAISGPTELLNSTVAERVYIKDEIIRVRVESDEFYDDEPGTAKLTEGVQVERESKRPPYTVTVFVSTTIPLVC